jgi:hypothetical protein
MARVLLAALGALAIWLLLLGSLWLYYATMALGGI